MKIELINTGTELLLGHVVNTHLAWLGQQLFPLGLRISRQTTVPDGLAIQDALLEARERKPDVLLITGGLGPTGDDVTREICSELFGLPLEENQEVVNAIEARLRKRGVACQQRMNRQAMVPQGAQVLPNAHGTAPGLYFDPACCGLEDWPQIILLPGPPRELKPMFLTEVLPILRRLSGGGNILQMQVYRVIGMGESAVEAAIGREIEASGDVEVGYCARLNEVDFRLVGSAAHLASWHNRVLAVLGDHLLSQNAESLEECIIQRLTEIPATLATAESCTGGLLAHRLTNVPGASAVFLQGLVVYSNAAKESLLGVEPAILHEHGAVSAPVARAMAEGVLKRSNADYALSTTGIAGPGGGSPEKPVGTIFFGLASKNAETQVWKNCLPFDRESFKQIASQYALDALRRLLLH